MADVPTWDSNHCILDKTRKLQKERSGAGLRSLNLSALCALAMKGTQCPSSSPKSYTNSDAMLSPQNKAKTETYRKVYAHIQTHTNAHMQVHAHTYTNTHIHAHTHTHTYMHTHTQNE